MSLQRLTISWNVTFDEKVFWLFPTNVQNPPEEKVKLNIALEGWIRRFEIPSFLERRQAKTWKEWIPK